MKIALKRLFSLEECKIIQSEILNVAKTTKWACYSEKVVAQAYINFPNYWTSLYKCNYSQNLNSCCN